ncbi:MAG: hypothetical protein FWH16_04685 [Oscillospiraceae bacterium]|nr:hypothetical protein [Oscillospiraceae bacterium]
MTLVKQCLLLFWLQVKMRLGLSAMRYYRKHDKKKFNMTIFIIIAAVYGVCATLFMYGLVYRAIITSAVDLGLGSLVIAATVLLAMIMSLFFGTFQLNAAVFNAKDVEWYAPMPLKPEAVFFSKFGVVYLVELAISAFIMLPAYVLYSVEAGAGVGFWAVAVLTLPFVPVIPLALSALLALPLSKLASRFRNRELIMTVFTVALVLAATAGGMIFSTAAGRAAEGDTAMLANMFNDAEPILRMMTSVFPPAMWLSLGLTFADNAAVSLLLFFAVSLASLALAVYLAGKFYYAGVLAILETPPKKRKAGRARRNDIRAASPVFALARADFMQILRTPIYALNSFSGIFFGLIVFIMPITLGAEWVLFKAQINSAIAEANPSFLLALMTLVGAASGLINPAASTAFSRDGRSMWLFQSMPAAPKVQVTAKVVSAAVIASVGAAVILACVCVMLPQLIPYAVMGFVPAVLTVASAASMSMIPDIISPKLKWDNEAEAIKQNMNAMWGMFTSLPSVLVMLGVLGVIAFTGANVIAALILLLAISAGAAYGGLYIANRVAEPRFRARGEKL